MSALSEAFEGVRGVRGVRGVNVKLDVNPGNELPARRHKDPGGLLGPIFVGYVPLASQNPCPIIVIFYGQL